MSVSKVEFSCCDLWRAVTQDRENDKYSIDATYLLTSRHLSDVLAWSILGRMYAVHKYGTNHADLLEFHTRSQTLSIRRSGCEYQKGMYSTLFGFCIVMLTFVLAVGILSKKPEKEALISTSFNNKASISHNGMELNQNANIDANRATLTVGTRNYIRYRPLASHA